MIILLVPFFKILIAPLISFKLEAPVEIITGFLVLDILFNKG